jgi:hypothetical protein
MSGNLRPWCLAVAVGLAAAAAGWADPVVPLPVQENLPSTGLAANAVPPAVVVSPPQRAHRDLDDTLPLFSLEGKTVDVRIDLLAQQTKVDPVSVSSGVGLLVDIRPL